MSTFLAIIVVLFVVFGIIYIVLLFKTPITNNSYSKSEEQEEHEVLVERFRQCRLEEEAKQRRGKTPIFKILNRPGNRYDDALNTYFVGMKHHINESDVCVFLGWIANDENNVFNNRAMAVYNDSCKLLGYIPEKVLKEYWQWSEGDTLPCAGIIYIDKTEDTPQLYGRVKAFKVCNAEFLQEEVARYLDYLKDTYGEGYFSRPLDMNINLEE